MWQPKGFASPPPGFRFGRRAAHCSAQVLVPPVIGILLGIGVGAVEPLRNVRSGVAPLLFPCAARKAVGETSGTRIVW